MIDIQTVLTYLTLISVPVGVFYHIMTLRNTRKNQEMQLETRQAQLFMQLYDKTMSKEFTDAHKEFSGLRFDDYTEYKDWIMNLPENPKKYDAWAYLATFYEGLGLLVMEGLASIRMVSVFMGSTIIGFYERFGGEYVHKLREETGSKGTLSETEYLYNEIKKYLEEHPELKT